MAFTKQQASNLLRNTRLNGRIPHALLIAGTEAAGCHEIVLQLAYDLNGAEASSIESLRHPSCRVLRPSSRSRSILISDIREVEPFLSLRAAEGQTKLVIILEADRMKEEAANAFLKTLEEPPDHTLIILMTEQPARLLPTILSRCIRMELRDTDSSLRLSKVQKLFLPNLQYALSLVSKKEGDIAAMGLSSDFRKLLDGRKQEISKRVNDALKIEAKSISEGSDYSNWEASQKDATLALIESEYLSEREELLELMSLALGQAVLIASEAPQLSPLCPELIELSQRCSIHELIYRMRAVDKLRQKINFNVNEPLCLDVHMLVIIGSRG